MMVNILLTTAEFIEEGKVYKSISIVNSVDSSVSERNFKTDVIWK